MEIISVEMIHAVVKEVLNVLKWMEPFQTRSLQKKKKERLGMYVATCSELVYTTKYSLIRVGSDVKQY